MAKFSIKNRILSFKYAFEGFKVVFKSEHNAWIHISISIVTIALGLYLDLSNNEWVAIILCIGMVISAEIFNTAIEHISNFIQPNHDIKIKHIKDLGSAGVLSVAISAFLVGLIIFLPKILGLF